MKITPNNLRQIIREELARELREVAQMYHAGSELGMSAEPVLTGQVEFDWGRYSQTGGHGHEWYYIHPDRNDELGEVQSAGDPFTYTKVRQQAPNVMVVSGPDSKKQAIGAVIALPQAWEMATVDLPSDEQNSMDMIRAAARYLSSKQLPTDESPPDEPPYQYDEMPPPTGRPEPDLLGAPRGTVVTKNHLTWTKDVVGELRFGREYMYDVPAWRIDSYDGELRVSGELVGAVLITQMGTFRMDPHYTVAAKLSYDSKVNHSSIPTYGTLEDLWQGQ
jgi:hypothetical protein